MICSRCGESNLDSAIYCHKCGAHVTPKDPKLALFLSFLATGLGQFYNRQYFKGLFCLTLYAIGVFLSFMIAVHIYEEVQHPSSNGGVMYSDLIDAAPFIPLWGWQLLDKAPYLLLTPIFTLIFWIWGMRNAYQTANRTIHQE
jgi:TM2 domain-containing membrane protein YozV